MQRNEKLLLFLKVGNRWLKTDRVISYLFINYIYIINHHEILDSRRSTEKVEN